MWKGRDVVSIEDVSRDDLVELLERATEFERNGYPKDLLRGKIIASLFFEASTRTRLSFEAAIQRLGAGVIGFSDAGDTSFAKKGESFSDTIRMVDGYADAIIMRHPESGSAAAAADIAGKPFINAGDGANEHPTQTLLDLFAIQQTQGTLGSKPMHVALVGDLKYGRVPHSLAKALALFPEVKQYWVAPTELAMPQEQLDYVKTHNIEVEQVEKIDDIIEEVDILYMTRVQAERFEDAAQYEAVKDVYVLSPALLKKAKASMRILHALPRRFEIPESIDVLPQAWYFEQAAGGVPVRAALLSLILEQ